MIWDNIEAATRPDVDSGEVVLSIADVDMLAAFDAALSAADDMEPLIDAESCAMESTAALSLIELPANGGDVKPFAIAPRPAQGMLGVIGASVISFVQNKTLPRFSSAYRSVAALAGVMGLSRIRDDAALTHTMLVGTVSTYNPHREGSLEGDAQTASGEPYDPSAWTAAVQTDLRNQFGGVRYGRLYQPAFALVESGEKRVIVRINDVGPLKPGRVLDLNERSMRHFDPFLTRGLIDDVKITLLPGEDWTPGPVGVAYALDFPAAARRPTPELAEVSHWQTETSLMPSPHRYVPASMTGDVRAEITPSTGG